MRIRFTTTRKISIVTRVHDASESKHFCSNSSDGASTGILMAQRSVSGALLRAAYSAQEETNARWIESDQSPTGVVRPKSDDIENWNRLSRGTYLLDVRLSPSTSTTFAETILPAALTSRRLRVASIVTRRGRAAGTPKRACATLSFIGNTNFPLTVYLRTDLFVEASRPGRADR
ncbi:hypothetical protein KM043_008746 [Ampulex compressa]|nr:hypothetical protein KM043_008746 [Ampulex compressa]